MCSICSHKERHLIESKLLEIGPEHPEVTVESIADAFKVNVSDLRVHAVMHAPLHINEEEIQNNADAVRSSIAAQTKVRESDYLKAVMDEYLITLRNVSRRINSRAALDNDDISFEKTISKAVVDLYLGVGSEIRSCVKTLAEVNSLLNGPKEGASDGLTALANAINNSTRALNGDSND